MMSEVWEPYAFDVGDRVICRPSPECPVSDHDKGFSQGETGTVAYVLPRDHNCWLGWWRSDDLSAERSAREHRIMVLFDEPVLMFAPNDRNARCIQMGFPAAELELLSEGGR